MLYALLVGEPGEKDLATFECYEPSAGGPLLYAEREVEIGEAGKTSVAAYFEDFRYRKAGDYRFILTCRGKVIAEQTLPVVLS